MQSGRVRPLVRFIENITDLCERSSGEVTRPIAEFHSSDLITEAL